MKNKEHMNTETFLFSGWSGRPHAAAALLKMKQHTHTSSDVIEQGGRVMLLVTFYHNSARPQFDDRKHDLWRRAESLRDYGVKRCGAAKTTITIAQVP